jgi:ribose transport system permease protein
MSVGMVGRLSALLAAVVLEALPGATPLALIVGVLVGLLVGAVNGAIITLTGAAPFIVTLGMFGAIEGLCLAVTQTSTALVPPRFQQIYTASVGGFPIAVLVMAAIWVLAYLFLKLMPLGRDLYAVGGGTQVARSAGIRVHRVRLLAYVISGALGAVAGLFLLAQSGVGNNTIAANLEFQSIVAVALGGASLFGGLGTIAGTLGAVLLLTVVTDVFQLSSISTYYQNVFQGGVILVAVLLYASTTRANETVHR